MGKIKTLPVVWHNNLMVLNVVQDLDLDFDAIFRIQVGKGNNTLFWLDNWTGGGTFCTRFPQLYHKDRRKRCLVSERVKDDVVQWSWVKKPDCI